MEWEQGQREDWEEDITFLHKNKEGRLSTLLPKIPSGWAFLVWQLTKYSTNSPSTHKVSEKNLAFKLYVWICSLCPSYNCSNLKEVYFQTGFSGPSCLGSPGLRPLKDRSDWCGTLSKKGKWFQGHIQVSWQLTEHTEQPR